MSFYSGDSSIGTCDTCGSPVRDGGQSGAYCSNAACPNGWYGGNPPERRAVCPQTVLYLSHSANRRETPDWWLVEPRDNPDAQVESLLQAGRRVLQLNTVRYEIKELSR